MIVTIEAFGEAQVSRELLGLSIRGDDPTPVFAAVRERFFQLEEKQFDSQGAEGAAGTWAPLAPSTVASKAAAGMDPRILHATLTLRDSLTKESSEYARYERMGNAYYHELFIGSAVPYGVYHQSTQPRHKLPRRPPVSIPEPEKVEWLKMIQRFIVTGEVE